jgi:tetratricopeptide (TPR) repeat protein
MNCISLAASGPIRDRIRALSRGLALLILAGFAGCAQGPQLRGYQDVGKAVELDGVPFYHQNGFQGAPAALAMMLGVSGVHANPDELVDLVYNKATKDSAPAAVRNAPTHYGRIGYDLRSKQIDLEVIHRVQSGQPVLVRLHDGFLVKDWRYVAVIGVDPDANTYTLRSGAAQQETMLYGDFLKAWHDSGYWAMVIERPGDLPQGATAAEWLGAAKLIEQAGKLEAAVQAYFAVSQRWGEEAEAWAGLGRTYDAMHNVHGAIIAFNNAVSLQPKNASYHYGLGQTLLERECADQAESEADLAVELEPDPNLRGPYLKLQKQTEEHTGPSVVCQLD